MSTPGIVAIFLGILIILSRGTLLFFPRIALRWFAEAVKTESRTRIVGAIAGLIAFAMIWSGTSDSTTLASVLFIAGIFLMLIAVGGLVLFPSAYMSIAQSIQPDAPSGALFGWRIAGLVGVIIGVVIFRVGMSAL